MRPAEPDLDSRGRSGRRRDRPSPAAPAPGRPSCRAPRRGRSAGRPTGPQARSYTSSGVPTWTTRPPASSATRSASPSASSASWVAYSAAAPLSAPACAARRGTRPRTWVSRWAVGSSNRYSDGVAGPAHGPGRRAAARRRTAPPGAGRPGARSCSRSRIASASGRASRPGSAASAHRVGDRVQRGQVRPQGVVLEDHRDVRAAPAAPPGRGRDHARRRARPRPRPGRGTRRRRAAGSTCRSRTGPSSASISPGATAQVHAGQRRRPAVRAPTGPRSSRTSARIGGLTGERPGRASRRTASQHRPPARSDQRRSRSTDSAAVGPTWPSSCAVQHDDGQGLAARTVEQARHRHLVQRGEEADQPGRQQRRRAVAAATTVRIAVEQRRRR